jgi:hypothetical protein
MTSALASLTFALALLFYGASSALFFTEVARHRGKGALLQLATSVGLG